VTGTSTNSNSNNTASTTTATNTNSNNTAAAATPGADLAYMAVLAPLLLFWFSILDPFLTMLVGLFGKSGTEVCISVADAV
jgi:hypothetical protein